MSIRCSIQIHCQGFEMSERTGNDWSKHERHEVLLLAALPPAAAILLTFFLYATKPAIWLTAFAVFTVCAYVTMFVALVPLLLLFKRFDWQNWFHYAIAGFAGVFFPWTIPALTIDGFEQSIAPYFCSWVGSLFSRTAIGFLVLPAMIAAAMSTAFWFICVHKSSRVDSS